ncbi:hypothetical protein [Frigidibacter mobilis]|uniref:Uncharacterized protein n=1 Tax=Frigidibacter mobilis TaxID=1335048 RepID=A0A159Z514_9RHOB|nr:hypothetical protein [Frigidibacter mobilis]AMY69460.1 hypothetical protein AKL17_2214 [Frigidibacter mobilis]
MTQQTYPGGSEALIALWQQRRGALGMAAGETLPLEADLAALARQPLPTELPPLPQKGSAYAKKRRQLLAELAGQSELALLNALCIAHLRRRRFPPEAPLLFHRIWEEQGDSLRGTLSTRWLISSIITFADHGRTEPQRRLGTSMNVLFSLMKLYEYERLHSRFEPDRAFGLAPRAKGPLPMGMPGFSLMSGELDVNLLAPIWAEALEVPVAGPLACQLLERLNGDSGTLFRRLATMRDKLRARRAAEEGE